MGGMIQLHAGTPPQYADARDIDFELTHVGLPNRKSLP